MDCNIHKLFSAICKEKQLEETVYDCNAVCSTTAAEGRNDWYGQRGRTTRKKRM